MALPVVPTHIPTVPPTLPPYALSAPVFRFRHLASLAGRAPIGGAREVALACFVAARLAADCIGVPDDDPSGRAGRCAGAKAWLGTLALPAAVRGSAAKCAELSVGGDPGEVGLEITRLVVAATACLDSHSRAELNAVSAALRG